MIKHSAKCRVIYGDTDGMGVAYHANYLRWFEMGRSELFRFLGLSYKDIESKGFYLPVSEVYCKFISSVKYDDILIIETSLDTNIKGGMKFNYRIFVEENEKHYAEGYTKHACLNREKKIVRRPAFLSELINKNI
jgi:acyl-CoA thioester hydrolase